MKLGALISGGKDSIYSIYKANEENKVVCLISLKPKRDDSYMFHVPNIELVEKIAENMKLPLIFEESSGIKEEELKDLERAIKKAAEKYKIEGIVAGAIASEYQASRVKAICDKLKLKLITPLWHIDEEYYMRELVKNFKVMVVGIAAEGLSEKWLGRILDQKAIDELIQMNKKTGLHIAGEGGEYESFVLDCPLYRKEFTIESQEKIMEGRNTGILRIVVK